MQGADLATFVGRWSNFLVSLLRCHVSVCHEPLFRYHSSFTSRQVDWQHELKKTQLEFVGRLSTVCISVSGVCFWWLF